MTKRISNIPKTSLFATLAYCVCSVGASTAQPAVQPTAQQSPQPSAVPVATPAEPEPVHLLDLHISTQPMLERLPKLRIALNELDPAQPKKYLLLGETLAAEAVLREDVGLAQHVLALAYLLEFHANQPSQEHLAGVCLALADAERLPVRARWLRSISEGIQPARSGRLLTNTSSFDDEQIGFRAATMLGHHRAGNMSQAERLLREPSVKAIIAKNQSLLIGAGEASSLTWIEDQIRLWPCPECRNARFIRRPGPEGVETRVCPWCHGDPGPELDSEQLIAHLRLESYLLSGIGRSWTAQVTRDFGSPLHDPDPDDLADVLTSRYGAMIEAPYFRDGEWVDSASTDP